MCRASATATKAATAMTPLATELFRNAQQVGATLYLHPIQRSDIEQDKDVDRRALRLRLIEKYLQLPNPPIPNSNLLVECGSPVQGSNGWILKAAPQSIQQLKEEAVSWIQTRLK